MIQEIRRWTQRFGVAKVFDETPVLVTTCRWRTGRTGKKVQRLVWLDRRPGLERDAGKPIGSYLVVHRRTDEIVGQLRYAGNPSGTIDLFTGKSLVTDDQYLLFRMARA